MKPPQHNPPHDLTVVDFGLTATKVIRVREVKGVLALAGAELLPVPPPDDGVAVEIAKPLRSRFCAVAFDGEEAMIRLIHFRESIEKNRQWEAKIRENLGIDSTFRLGYNVGTSTKGKARDRCLAVAIPEASLKETSARVQGFRQIFSMEVSSMASLTSFQEGPGRRLEEEAVAVVCAGAKVALLCIINRQQPVLIRKFQLGGEILAARVAEKLGIESALASQMVWQDSFDISTAVADIVDPFLHQLTISREFTERHENCKLSRVFVTGGLGQSAFLRRGIEEQMSLGVEDWNPFEAFEIPDGSLAPEVAVQASRFSASVGVALGVMRNL